MGIRSYRASQICASNCRQRDIVPTPGSEGVSEMKINLADDQMGGQARRRVHSGALTRDKRRGGEEAALPGRYRSQPSDQHGATGLAQRRDQRWQVGVLRAPAFLSVPAKGPPQRASCLERSSSSRDLIDSVNLCSQAPQRS